MIDQGFSVVLGPLDTTDLERCREWRNDPRIWQWCRQNDLISDTMQERWFDRQDSDPTIHMYAIQTKAGGKVGVCGLTSHDRDNRRAEFSLYVDPDEHGKGIGEDALKTLVAHGFLNLNLHVIWGETFDGNPALKLFEKVGFKIEGTRRNFYYKNGKYIDAHLVSMLDHEWMP